MLKRTCSFQSRIKFPDELYFLNFKIKSNTKKLFRIKNYLCFSILGKIVKNSDKIFKSTCIRKFKARLV